MGKIITTEDAKALAIKNGGKCLSDYVNCKDKMQWICGKGHVFQTSYNSIQVGHWCRACYDIRQKNDIKNIKSLSKKQNFKLLDEYKGIAYKHHWECLNCNTIYYTRLQNLRKKEDWCYPCFKIKAAKAALKKYGFKLISPLKGKTTKETDTIVECKNGHIIKRKMNLNMQMDRIVKAGGNLCRQCDLEKKRAEYLKEAKKHAAAKAGKCLSDIYINFNTKLEWECNLGHSWKTRWATVKQGSWCPVCHRIEKMNFRKLKNAYVANQEYRKSSDAKNEIIK